MFSIRKDVAGLHRSTSRSRRARFMLGLAATTALAGCFHHAEPVTDPVSSEPMVIDEAMQRRDWSRSVSEFYGGGVVAGATRFPYVPQTSSGHGSAGADRAIYGPERSN